MGRGLGLQTEQREPGPPSVPVGCQHPALHEVSQQESQVAGMAAGHLPEVTIGNPTFDLRCRRREM